MAEFSSLVSVSLQRFAAFSGLAQQLGAPADIFRSIRTAGLQNDTIELSWDSWLELNHNTLDALVHAGGSATVGTFLASKLPEGAVSPRESAFIVQDLAPLHSWTEVRLQALRSGSSKSRDSSAGNVNTVRVALLALLRRSWQAVVQLASNYVVPPAEGVAANATIRASCERIGILTKDVAASCADHLATLWDLARLADYQRVQSTAMEHLQSIGREVTVLLTEQRQITVNFEQERTRLAGLLDVSADAFVDSSRKALESAQSHYQSVFVSRQNILTELCRELCRGVNLTLDLLVVARLSAMLNVGSAYAGIACDWSKLTQLKAEEGTLLDRMWSIVASSFPSDTPPTLPTTSDALLSLLHPDCIPFEPLDLAASVDVLTPRAQDLALHLSRVFEAISSVQVYAVYAAARCAVGTVNIMTVVSAFVSIVGLPPKLCELAAAAAVLDAGVNSVPTIWLARVVASANAACLDSPYTDDAVNPGVDAVATGESLLSLATDGALSSQLGGVFSAHSAAYASLRCIQSGWTVDAAKVGLSELLWTELWSIAFDVSRSLCADTDAASLSDFYGQLANSREWWKTLLSLPLSPFEAFTFERTLRQSAEDGSSSATVLLALSRSSRLQPVYGPVPAVSEQAVGSAVTPDDVTFVAQTPEACQQALSQCQAHEPLASVARSVLQLQESLFPVQQSLCSGVVPPSGSPGNSDASMQDDDVRAAVKPRRLNFSRLVPQSMALRLKAFEVRGTMPLSASDGSTVSDASEMSEDAKADDSEDPLTMSFLAGYQATTVRTPATPFNRSVILATPATKRSLPPPSSGKRLSRVLMSTPGPRLGLQTPDVFSAKAAAVTPGLVTPAVAMPTAYAAASPAPFRSPFPSVPLSVSALRGPVQVPSALPLPPAPAPAVPTASGSFQHLQTPPRFMSRRFGPSMAVPAPAPAPAPVTSTTVPQFFGSQRSTRLDAFSPGVPVAPPHTASPFAPAPALSTSFLSPTPGPALDSSRGDQSFRLPPNQGRFTGLSRFALRGKPSEQ